MGTRINEPARNPSYPDSPYPLTIALLLREGIDPSTVLLGSVTGKGYDEVIVDENGKRLHKTGGNYITIPHTWRDEELGQLVLDTMQIDLATKPIKAPAEEREGLVDKVVLLRRVYDFDPKVPGAFGKWKTLHDQLTDEELVQYDASIAKVSETSEGVTP